ncbi:unnamed protein product [Rhizophagus irregularis]|nr:unnamed protein product [Rhizophagus irregularis]
MKDIVLKSRSYQSPVWDTFDTFQEKLIVLYHEKWNHQDQKLHGQLIIEDQGDEIQIKNYPSNPTNYKSHVFL